MNSLIKKSDYLLLLISLAIILLPGCSTTVKSHSHLLPQTIKIEQPLSVHLHSSLNELQMAYMFSGGDPAKIKRVKGFYSDKTNSIHCLKWDYYTCGHELFHSLQYKGNQTLVVEKGYEHFKENNYTSE